MLQLSNHKLNVFAEFVDPILEEEFLQDYMKYSARFIGPITLISAIIYMLFGFMDYLAVKDLFSLVLILTMRALFLLLAVVLFVLVKNSTEYRRFCGWVTAFEVLAALSFLVILHLYSEITFLSYLSVISITLTIYIVPNRIRNAQAVTIAFNFAFIAFFYNHLDASPTPPEALVVYDLMFMALGNVSAYVANLYKRRQFLDSREMLNMYLTDPLTGIANRVKFDQDLQKWISFCERYDEPLSLIIIDVDNFKSVNDSMGHLKGDQVVKNITSLFQSIIRSTDVFARWGGDEFALLLPGIDVHQGTEVAERLKAALAKYKVDIIGSVTCSFGLTSFRREDDARSFLLRADELLYLAKGRGKNAIAWTDGDNQVNYITKKGETA